MQAGFWLEGLGALLRMRRGGGRSLIFSRAQEALGGVRCHWAVLRGRRTGGLEFQLTSCQAALGRADVGGPFCGQGALARGLVSLPHRGPPGTAPEALLVAGENAVAALPLDWSSVTAQGTLPLTRGCPALVLVPVGRAEGGGSHCARGVAAVRVFRCQAAC